MWRVATRALAPFLGPPLLVGEGLGVRSGAHDNYLNGLVMSYHTVISVTPIARR